MNGDVSYATEIRVVGGEEGLQEFSITLMPQKRNFVSYPDY